MKMKKQALCNLDLDIYEETLDNGLRIFVIPKFNVNNIYVTFSTNYGSIQNEFLVDGQMIKVPDGVAHFLEHKVFEQKDGIDPFSFYSKSGSDCNANTSNYKTTYLFVGQEKLKENLNYLLDFVQSPYFTDENVEKEKGIIEQEIKMYQDDPETSSVEKIVYNSFINHPIKIPIIGTVESINKITKEDLYNCYNTFYNPKNMFVVVTGNVNPKEIFNIIKDNQKKKNFKKINEIKLKEYVEPDYVSSKKETIYQNVTIPKVLVGYKFNIENIGIDKRTLNNFIGIFADLKFGYVSKFTEQMKKEGLITKDIDFCTIKTDKHLLLILEAETEYQEETLTRIDKEIKTFEFQEKEFNRKKKTALSSCIYMTDSIYSLNSFVMNSIILEKEINYDIYNHYKKLKFKDFIKFNKKLNFDNKTVLYVNNLQAKHSC